MEGGSVEYFKHSKYIRVRVIQDQYDSGQGIQYLPSAYRILAIPKGWPFSQALDFILQSTGYDDEAYSFFMGWGHWEGARAEDDDFATMGLGRIFSRKGKKASLVIWRDLPLRIRLISESHSFVRDAGQHPFIESEYGSWVTNNLSDYLASDLGVGCSWLAPALASAASF